MKISQTGIKLIQSFEGCRLSSYKPVPTETYYTIGWGHYGSDVNKNDVITQQQADEMLLKDLHLYEVAVSEGVKVKINQNQFDSLVSFCYNVGIGAFLKSTLLEQVNKSNFVDASNEFSKWVHSGKTVLKGLVLRRKAEQDLFNKIVPKKHTEYIEKYKVKDGDTLTVIARVHQTTVDRLLKLNANIKSQDKIYAGQTIKVPKI